MYGLGTAYSAAFIMFGKFFSLLIILLLGDALATSVVLMAALIAILLVLFAFDRLETTLINGEYQKVEPLVIYRCSFIIVRCMAVKLAES